MTILACLIHLINCTRTFPCCLTSYTWWIEILKDISISLVLSPLQRRRSENIKHQTARPSLQCHNVKEVKVSNRSPSLTIPRKWRHQTLQGSRKGWQRRKNKSIKPPVFPHRRSPKKVRSSSRSHNVQKNKDDRRQTICPPIPCTTEKSEDI